MHFEQPNAVFRWLGKPLEEDRLEVDPQTRYSSDHGEQWAHQAAEPVARAIFDSIRNRGHGVAGDAPWADEREWVGDVLLDGQTFALCVHEVVRSDDRRDAFAVQPSLRRGWLASLLLPKPPAAALQPICSLLDQVLSNHPLIADVRWVRDVWTEP